MFSTIPNTEKYYTFDQLSCSFEFVNGIEEVDFGLWAHKPGLKLALIVHCCKKHMPQPSCRSSDQLNN